MKEELIQISVHITEPQGRWKWCGVKPVWVPGLSSDVGLSFQQQGLAPKWRQQGRFGGFDYSSILVLPQFPLWIPSSVPPPFPGRTERRARSMSWTLLLARWSWPGLCPVLKGPHTRECSGWCGPETKPEIPGQLIPPAEPMSWRESPALGSSILWRVTRHLTVTGSPRGCLLEQSLTGQNCLLFHLHDQWWLQHRIKKKDPNIKSNLKAKDKTPDQLQLLNTVHL